MAALRRYRWLVSAESPPGPAASGPAAAGARPGGLEAPRITSRRARFWMVLDYVIAAGCAVIIYSVLFKGTGGGRLQVTVAGARGWLPLLLALGLAVPVAARRRRPVRSLVIVLIGCAVVLLVGGEVTRGPFLPLALVLYRVAATCRRRVALAGLAAATVVLVAQGIAMRYTGTGSGNAIAATLVLTICWMAGYAVQLRRANVAQLRDRAASDAVTRERLRIARELHDVVAHSMTVVTVQAGFGEYVFDDQPDEARAALGAIQTVSREALGELQRLLCVLRQPDPEPAGSAGLAVLDVRSAGPGQPAPPDGAAPLAPVPGLATLDRLAERTAGAGVQVTVERAGAVREIPAGIDVSAFRIVQEALTNVVKHSGADHCRVAVSYGVRDLLVEITDPGPGLPAEAVTSPAGLVAAGTGAVSTSLTGPPAAGTVPRASLPYPALPRAGHGLIGMQERVSLCGGEFTAGPLPEGGFGVRARLPVTAAAP